MQETSSVSAAAKHTRDQQCLSSSSKETSSVSAAAKETSSVSAAAKETSSVSAAAEHAGDQRCLHQQQSIWKSSNGSIYAAIKNERDQQGLSKQLVKQ